MFRSAPPWTQGSEWQEGRTAAGRVSRKDALVEKCYLPVNSGMPGSYCWLSAKHCQDTKSQFMSGFSLTHCCSFLTFLGQLILEAGTG